MCYSIYNMYCVCLVFIKFVWFYLHMEGLKSSKLKTGFEKCEIETFLMTLIRKTIYTIYLKGQVDLTQI